MAFRDVPRADGVKYYEDDGRIPGARYFDDVSRRFSGETSSAAQGSAQDARAASLSRSQDYSTTADVDPVWDMMLRGTESLKSDLQFAMRTGDRARFDSAVATARKFREEHIDDIRNVRYLTGMHDDPDSVRISQTADSWDKFNFLDGVAVSVTGPRGQQTSMTAGDFMRMDTPSNVASRDFQFDKWAADAYTDKGNEWYSAFGAVREAMDGANSAAANDQARTSVATQARTFARVYGKFLSGNRDSFAGPDDAAAFGHAALQYFGFDLSSNDLAGMAKRWSDERSYNPDADVYDWIRGRKEAYDSVKPQVPQSAPGSRTASANAGQQDPMITSRRARTAYDQFSEIASQHGERVSPDSPAANGGLRKSLAQYARLSKNVDLPSSYNDAPAKSAFGRATGRFADSRLDDAEAMYAKACGALGYGYDSTTGEVTGAQDDVGRSAEMARTLPKAVTEAFTRSGLSYGDFMSVLSSKGETGGTDGSYYSAMASIVRSIRGSMPELSEDDATLLANRYVGNLTGSGSESFNAMTASLGGVGVRVAAAAAASPASDDYTILRAPSSSDRGKVLKTWESLESVASGNSPLLGQVASEGDRMALRRLAGGQRSVSMTLDRGDPVVSTEAMFGDAGTVLMRSMDQTVHLGDSIPDDIRNWVKSGDAIRFFHGSDKAVGTTQGDPDLIQGTSRVVSSAVRALESGRKNMSPETKSFLGGIVAYGVSALANRGGWTTLPPDLSPDVYDFVQKYGGQNITENTAVATGFAPLGVMGGGHRIERRLVDLDDDDANQLCDRLKGTLSSSLGVSVSDPFAAGGMNLPRIGGAEKNVDLSGILNVAMGGLQKDASESAVVAEDEMARGAKVASGRPAEEADAERPGAGFRRLRAHMMSNDDKVNVLQQKMIRNIRRQGLSGDDDIIKTLVSTQLSAVEDIIRESASFEDAERMVRPYLDSRLVYGKDPATNQLKIGLLSPADFAQYLNDYCGGNEMVFQRDQLMNAEAFNDQRAQARAESKSFGAAIGKSNADQ